MSRHSTHKRLNIVDIKPPSFAKRCWLKCRAALAVALVSLIGMFWQQTQAEAERLFWKRYVIGLTEQNCTGESTHGRSP